MKDLFETIATEYELENELISRYKERLKRVWREPNPYYVKGIFPTEAQEIKQWIDKLEIIKQKS